MCDVYMLSVVVLHGGVGMVPSDVKPYFAGTTRLTARACPCFFCVFVNTMGQRVYDHDDREACSLLWLSLAAVVTENGMKFGLLYIPDYHPEAHGSFLTYYEQMLEQLSPQRRSALMAYGAPSIAFPALLLAIPPFLWPRRRA